MPGEILPAVDTALEHLSIIMNITWKQADHDVYVATRDGEYAGFVAVDGASHVLHDRHSRRLGSYPSLSAARSALESFGAPASAAPHRSRRPARSRRRTSPARGR
ncbi:hypothetical protein [Microbacterium sp. 13-71-7]|uniref:hypothetical protein n=1 Tax=Microbacterium sp. 13-71-7 TaxID=1970399 RepID=UPI000BC917A9|nr:hypothetical protein [Microbacterium sp. 13-71-7]OZB82124.1 MAG: hypothetical protein B7X32_14685 [Microbacterium sp. 13-71-7]